MYCIVVYGFSLSHFSWLPVASDFGCGDGFGVLYLLSAEHFVMRGLAGNLSDLTVASSQYDILLSSEILASDMRHVPEVLVPGFGRPVLLCRGKMPRAHVMAVYVRDGYGALRHKFECGCCEMLVLKVCGVRQNLYVYSLYRNPDLDDRIFGCLLALMLPRRLRMSVPLSCL